MQNGLVIDDLYQRIKSKIRPYWVTAFVAGMVIGVLTYGYLMANHFLTYDSMWNLYSDQDMITSGRQFLTYACGVSSYYDLPWLNGLLAVFYLSLTSVLVVEGLGIRNRLNAALAAGLIVTFPSVISTFCYTFTVDGYMLATLLATAAFLLTDRKKWGCVGGIVLLGIALGIYQAFISFTIVLCILRLLLDLLKEMDLKKILVKTGSYAVMGIGGYLFYVLTLKGMLELKGQELSGYQGTDRVGSLALGELPAGFQSAWKAFKEFVLYGNVLTTTNAMKTAVVVLTLAGISIYGVLFVHRVKARWGHYLVAAVLVAAIPFGATAVNIISPDTYHHTLMRGSWSLFFVFVVALTEWLSGDTAGKIKKLMVSAVALFSVVLIFEFSVMANIVGYNMHERYEKNYAICIRLVERLETTEGYEHGMKVAILGGGPDKEVYPSTDITSQDLVGYFGATGDFSLNSTEKYAVFMSHYMNVTLQTISAAQEEELVNTQKFQEMPKFPSEGSIQKIDDVWVVKLNG